MKAKNLPPNESLLHLQWKQLVHDEGYHKDILNLPLGQRVKHMALHMAKYVGYLVETDDDDEERVAHILTDAFIITLATANALNQSLSEDLGLGVKTESLKGLGLAVGPQPANLNSVLGLLLPLARHTGTLAKACESLDHMEPFPFRQAMRKSNLELFKVIIAAAAARDLDLAKRHRTRLRFVEERSIFDPYIQPSALEASA